MLRWLGVVVALLPAARALRLAAAPRRATALRGSPLDGFANALKDAFANDAEFAPAARPAADGGAAADGDWAVTLRLVGVPERDPSNDLFGPRMRITDDERGISAEEVTANLRLSRDGSVEIVDASAPLFAEDAGAYSCVDGRLSVRLASAGFTRTFTTTGSLQSVYGGGETARTSSVYAIPEGPLLLAGTVETLPSTGERVVRKGTVACVARTGFFGAVEKTSPAGSFSATTRPLGGARGGGD